MRINNNISAVITNKQLLRTEDSLSDAMERLSSGLRINHAKDDPSGMAISSKMDTQVEGLDMASRNASDGISIIQSADGALKEVTDMLQRMRELSVQAANDTNAPTERQAIQDEIVQLKQEIDRVSSTTEFNTKKLLDGSLDARVYAGHASRENVSDAVTAGTYNLAVTAATKGEVDGTVPTDAVPADAAGTVIINNQPVQITAGMSAEEAFEAIRKAGERGDVTVERDTTQNQNKLKFTTGITTDGTAEALSNAYGDKAVVSVKFDNANLAQYFGMQESNTGTGTSASVTLTRADDGFSQSATASVNGRRVTITDVGGFSMDFLVDEDPDNPGQTYAGDISVEVTTLGPMSLQIGANENQNMSVRIPSTSAASLYIDQINVTAYGGPDRAIAQLDEAIDQLSQIRADLGANQNRLEHTTKSLDETSENMSSALSRIEDVDMAEEMTEYTKYNVLQQSATSALAQANEIPQMALQLLQ